MADITFYKTTDKLTDVVLDAYSSTDKNLTVADIVERSFIPLSNYFKDLGGYNISFAPDGSFVVETASYITSYFGDINASGSNINHIVILEKSTGSQTELDGIFKYDGEPYYTSLIGDISQLTTSYKLSGDWYAQDSYDFNSSSLDSWGNFLGDIGTIIGTMINGATNENFGVRLDGAISFSGNLRSPNFIYIHNDGVIDSQANIIYDFESGNVSDSVTATDIAWPIDTPLKDLQLNAGNDSYHLTGMLGSEVNGGDGNDYFYSSLGDDSIDGEKGIDTVIFSNTHSNYTLVGSANNYTVTGTDGADMLLNIERINYTDEKIALDLSGNAGITAKVLGAIFGKDSVSNAKYVVIGLNLLDNGMSYSDIVKFAIDARLGNGSSNSSVVNLLYTNVVGVSPPANEQNYYVGLLDSGIHTIASLGMFAADTTFNTQNINLAGISTTGLEFI